jgi:Zn-dependent alcohol dehydrogenase
VTITAAVTEPKGAPFEHNFASPRPVDGSSALSRGGEPVHGQFKLPDDIDLQVAAPFGCGIQTGAGAVFVNTILSGGRVVRGIVEGDSVPDVFLPRLMTLHRQGRFPVEALMTFYDFDQIEQAAPDAEAGRTIEPVLRLS